MNHIIKPIVLMGFMGSGKSTLGTRLAAKLDMPFTDLDRRIESAAGKTIPEIFGELGESAFRELESEALIRVFHEPIQVIAIGGGAPCREDHISLIKEQSVSVYLKISVDALFNRLWKQSPGRPLIAGKNPEELKSFIDNLLTTRERFYCQADIILESDQITVNQILTELTRTGLSAG